MHLLIRYNVFFIHFSFDGFVNQKSFQEGFGRLITSGKIMRKLPQDFAFPLGLGSKKHNSTNHTGDSHKSNLSTSTMPAGSSNDDDSSPRAPCQDLDTINL